MLWPAFIEAGRVVDSENGDSCAGGSLRTPGARFFERIRRCFQSSVAALPEAVTDQLRNARLAALRQINQQEGDK